MCLEREITMHHHSTRELLNSKSKSYILTLMVVYYLGHSLTANEIEVSAAGVEAGKTKEVEKSKAVDEGKDVVEPSIGEAKPVTETE
jgi:hypothetical protein